MLLALSKPLYQLAICHLQDLCLSTAAGNHSERWDNLAHATTYFALARRKRSLYLALDCSKDIVIDSLNLLHRVGTDKDAVILQQDNFRLTTVLGNIVANLLLDTLVEQIPRIRVRNIESFIAKQTLALGLNIDTRHQAVNHCWVQMHHKWGANSVMERTLY